MNMWEYTGQNTIAENTIPKKEYPVTVSFTDLSSPYKTTAWQFHEEMEITIIHRGSLQVMTETGIRTLSEGQGVIFNQNTIHRFLPMESAECSYYCIHFNPVFLFSYDLPITTLKYLKPVLKNPSLSVIYLDKGSAWEEAVLQLIHDLITVNLSKEEGYELISRGYLYHFWHLLFQKMNMLPSQPVQKTSSPDMKRLRAAITYIEEHYAENISLDNIAASVHISKSECCRCFKRNLHLTPFEYLLKYRIFVATREMIQEPNQKSISDLALSVGFNTPSYFNKVFKKFINCTPSEYKALVKKAETDGTVTSLRPYEF